MLMYDCSDVLAQSTDQALSGNLACMRACKLTADFALGRGLAFGRLGRLFIVIVVIFVITALLGLVRVNLPVQPCMHACMRSPVPNPTPP